MVGAGKAGRICSATDLGITTMFQTIPDRVKIVALLAPTVLGTVFARGNALGDLIDQRDPKQDVNIIASMTAKDEATSADRVSSYQVSEQSAAREANQARIIYHLARSENDDSRRAMLFESGLKHAEVARRLAPELPAALLWWVANMGEVALARGKLRALVDVPKLEQALLKLLKIDPNFENAAADRGLARLYQLAPPFISVGSMSDAALHYAAALKRAPKFMGNLALYADFLEERGEHLRAQELARAALQADQNGIDAASIIEWGALAKAVLEIK